MESLQTLIKLFLLTITVGLFSSCISQKIAFTSDIQDTYKFSEERLQTIQFYTSDDIVLYVNKNHEATRVVNGKVVINSSDVQDAIIIPRNTPCILEKKINDNILIVGFETGTGRQICFINNGNTYSIGAKEWSGEEGLLKYGGKNYFTANREAYLMIKVRKLNHIIRSQRTIKGRKISH